MADFHCDQAAGLRRLLGVGQLQVVSFVAGCEGVGRSVAVANLGVALARLGKEVLIIDEQVASDDVASLLGVASRFDLLNVVQREMRLDEVLLQPMKGLRILPASRAVKKLGRLSLPQQQTLLDAMSGLAHPVDVILIDASVTHASGFSPFALASQDVVVVLSGNSASITEAYALIKKVSHTFARRHFRILVNKVRSLADARSIFDNIAQVARLRGIASLEFAGGIPNDDALRKAASLSRPVLIQSPEAPAAKALRDIAGDILYWQSGDSACGGVEQFMQQLLHLSQRLPPSLLRA